ncbi:MAG: SRPBCC family protein [Mangrovibacterium sp.]
MKTITVEVSIAASLSRVWDCWTEPEHISRWNFASPEWCCPAASNDVRPGGSFVWRMEARDGSMGFDFGGTYEQVEAQKLLTYRIADGRRVSIHFEALGTQTRVSESFETESTHTDKQQRAGWQAILDNFKGYTEGLGKQ